MNGKSVNEFISRAIQFGGWTSLDSVLLINRLKTLLGDFNELSDSELINEKNSVDLLADLLEMAEKNGKLEPHNEEKRAMLKEELMEFLTPPTSVVNALFSQHFSNSPDNATNYYHELNQLNGFIESNEIEQKKIKIDNCELIIDKRKKVTSLKSCCPFCFDSEGQGLFKNRIKRIIRMNLKGNSWGFFFESNPMIDEHAIFSSEKHETVEMTRASLTDMLRLLDIFPHYFVSYDPLSNQMAAHSHFFGGKKDIPLINSSDAFEFTIPGFVTVKCSLVNWPLSVIRLRTRSKKNLINSMEYLSLKWQQYSYPSLDIRATDANKSHLHTVIPVLTKEEDEYVAELILIDKSDAFNPMNDYISLLVNSNNIIDKLGIINIKPNITFDEALYTIIKRNFVQQQIFKETPEGKKAFIRFIDTL